MTAQANDIYDAHLDGSVAAHPEDGAWDGHSYTHSWYNTGQRRPEEERIGRPRILWGKPYYESKRAQFFQERLHPPCLSSFRDALSLRLGHLAAGDRHWLHSDQPTKDHSDS